MTQMGVASFHPSFSSPCRQFLKLGAASSPAKKEEPKKRNHAKNSKKKKRDKAGQSKTKQEKPSHRDYWGGCCARHFLFFVSFCTSIPLPSRFVQSVFSGLQTSPAAACFTTDVVFQLFCRLKACGPTHNCVHVEDVLSLLVLVSSELLLNSIRRMDATRLRRSTHKI